MPAASLILKSPLVRVVDEGKNRRIEMCCPKCGQWQDTLAFRSLEMTNEYSKALNVILKCVLCRHLFSPRWMNE